MANKVGTQLLLNGLTRDRGAVLALVRGESQAEIWRMAIEGSGLGALEKTHAAAIEEVKALASKFNMTAGELATRALKDRYSLEFLLTRNVYPRAKTRAS